MERTEFRQIVREAAREALVMPPYRRREYPEKIKEKGTMILNLLSGMTVGDIKEVLDYIEEDLMVFCDKIVFSEDEDSGKQYLKMG